MTTARSAQAELSSSRRAQPVRQTRNNPPRAAGLLPRSFSGRDGAGVGLALGQNPEQRTKIYPAITYFADAITALPKELMRHFTLLKEVDAKIFNPEETLELLVDAALNAPVPTATSKQAADATQPAGPTSAPDSASISVNGSVVNGPNISALPAPDAGESYIPAKAPWDPANVPRRQLFHQCRGTMQEMLVSLEEKNHVISTATEVLNKQLARLDECFPYLEKEISEEARYGSDRHWAYTETRSAKQIEKTRREVAAQNGNGFPVTVDEAAARSELRKQAMLAKKSRTHPIESDFDDHLDHKHKTESSKKPHGNTKKGRPAEVSANLNLAVANGNGANGNPPSKRRKVEKGPGGGAVMERSISSALNSNGVAAKGKLNSPSETPVPEASKRKSKSAATTNGNSRKRTTASVANAMSPSIASSPVHGTFADAKSLGRASPAPTNGARPPVSRARQNSAQSMVENARQRPSSSSSNKPNGITISTTELGSVAGVTGRSIPDMRASMKETAANAKGEHLIEDADPADPDMRGGLFIGGVSKDSIYAGTSTVGGSGNGVMKREDLEPNGVTGTTASSIPTAITTTTMTTMVTTKSGRASKPSTPALQSFSEAAAAGGGGAARSRSSRGGGALEATGAGGHNKRSHKKGAGQAAQQQQQQMMAAAAASQSGDGAVGAGHGYNHGQGNSSNGNSNRNVSDDDDDGDMDADEPTYCYCNGVSYGEMVACDAEGCAKEWFHLDCVGLKVAPKGNAKWYCDDCKEIMKNSKRFTGR